ncbi:MAG: WD40 repeat domain-containing protein [Anaerolineae bacterium]
MKYTNTLKLAILFLFISFTQVVFAQVRLEANEGTRQVMWSPDGTRLVTANPDGEVRIWDVSGQLVTSFVAHPDGTRAASWSPDGSRLATGGAENIIKIWDDTGNLLSSFATSYEIAQIDWHPDSSRIVVLGFNILDIWDTSTGQFISFVPSGTTMDMAWSPDGIRLAHISLNDNLYIADATTYQNISSANTPNGTSLNQVAWHPDNSHVITSDAFGEIRLWDASDLSDLGVVAQVSVNGLIKELAYSPDGTLIAVAVDNGFVYIVDANTGAILDTITTNYPVLSVDWNPDSSAIAYVGVDEDANPDNDLKIIMAPSSMVCDLTISASDTSSLISAITTGNTAGSSYTLSPNALPIITGAITIIGNSATITRDVSAPDVRIFRVGDGATLTLENLTLNGRDPIDNAGTVRLQVVTLAGDSGGE